MKYLNEIFEETWSKNKNKEKGPIIGPRKGISQESQDQILALKYPEGRGRVGGKFCVADTASVILNNSKSKDERKKGISLQENLKTLGCIRFVDNNWTF